jgi:hypothetical protein
MKKKNFFKGAVVLLCTVLMMVSSAAVIATTSTTMLSTSVKNDTAVSLSMDRSVVWDNVMGVHGSRGGIIVATVRTEGCAFPADDFQFTTEQTVTSVAWQGGYFQCQLAQGQKDYHWDWRVLFWDDIGNGSWPGTEIYNQTIPDASVNTSFWYNYTRSDGQTYWVANYSCQLPVSITFDANTKYWVTFQTIQTPNTYPQGCWVRHNDTDGGIKLHESMIKAVWWGYPNWVTVFSLLGPGGDPDPRPHDLNYQLIGPGGDTTPPETHCDFAGTNPVTVTITATDDSSGVNYTMYNLDAGGWVEYTTPFIVSEPGDHTLQCYSVDKVGNTEIAHYCNFTVEQPPLTITITKGFGITTVIKNTGTATLTNISWSIECTGGIIVIGQTKFGDIPSLEPGEEYKAKDFVLGFGRTTIGASADGASANATGLVLLIFVL